MSGRYDLCILGAGPAGLAAAARAHDLGKRVALIEPGRAGGVGIGDGALSSKTLWHLSLDFARARRHGRGYDGRGLAVVWADVVAEVAAACGEAWAHAARLMASLTAPSPRGGQVDVLVGRGRFVARDRVVVEGAAGAAGGEPAREVVADRFLIAVGSRPRGLPGVIVDGDRICTSDHIERLPSLPGRLAVVGAGVVGCEYATIFANLGATQVELFDRGPRILPFEDADVAATIADSFRALGVQVHGGARLDRIERDRDEVRLIGRMPGPDGAEVAFERRVDRVLLAVGRTPSLDGLGLEHAGIALERGGIVCPHAGRATTTAAHVWAAGDVTCDVMLANVAEQEGRHAVDEMFGRDPHPIAYEAKSAIYFFCPEVGAVGLNEQMAQAAKLPYRAAVVSLSLVRRAIAMRATDGFVKLLASPDGKVLGLRVVGPHASSCIQGVALLIEHGGTLDELERCPHPHPAVTEGVQEAARLLLGTSIYKPAAFPGLVRLIEHAGG